MTLRWLLALKSDAKGQDLVEYGLLLLVFALAWAATSHSVVNGITAVFNGVGSTLTSTN